MSTRSGDPTSLLTAMLVLAPMSAGAAEPDPAAPDSTTQTRAYSPGVFAQGFVGAAGVHRHVAPLIVPDKPGFYRLALGLGARVGGVSARAPTVEIAGEARFYVASTVRVEGSPSTEPKGRPLGGSAWAGATWWPRSMGHRFGVGAELGHTVAPFVIEAGPDERLASYGVHGPVVGARLEGETRRGRVLFMARPYVGVALPYRLEGIAIDRPAAQVGTVLQSSVRLYGPLYLVVDVLAWNARLRRSGHRPSTSTWSPCSAA